MNYNYFKYAIEQELERVANHIVNYYQQEETTLGANIGEMLFLETTAKWQWRKDHDIGMVEVDILSCITKIMLGENYFEVDTTEDLHYIVINEEIDL